MVTTVTITLPQIAAILKAADPLTHLQPHHAKIVGSVALMDKLHDLDVTTKLSDFETLVKDVAKAVKRAKELNSKDNLDKEAEEAISYVNSTVKGLCKGDILTKLISIQQAGTGEKGHGAVEFLGGALHAHVTNSIGVAWKWESGKVKVVAVGKKNDKNPIQDKKKTEKYDWTTK
jgi:hypothetical protein